MVSKKVWKEVFWLLVGFLIINTAIFYGVVWAYESGFKETYWDRSVLSVEASCNTQSVQEAIQYASQRGYRINGFFDPSNVSITIFSPNLQVSKHELCHLEQFREERLYGCDRKFLRILNELECYLAED